MGLRRSGRNKTPTKSNVEAEPASAGAWPRKNPYWDELEGQARKKRKVRGAQRKATRLVNQLRSLPDVTVDNLGRRLVDFEEKEKGADGRTRIPEAAKKKSKRRIKDQKSRNASGHRRNAKRKRKEKNKRGGDSQNQIEGKDLRRKPKESV